MFDSIGFPEIALIGIIALIVVGPKDLPILMRKAGRFMNKMRGMAADFRANFDELARQAELDELRKEIEALKANTPLKDIQDELNKPFDHGIDFNRPVTPLSDDEPDFAAQAEAPIPTGNDPYEARPAPLSAAAPAAPTLPASAPAPVAADAVAEAPARKARARRKAAESAV